MICTKCGKENQEGANFCRYCGNSLQKNLAALIERARRNDQSAISEIYWCSSTELYRVVKVLVRDDDTVNDILQDTYIKAFARLDQLQDPERLIPWLKVIANNTAKDWLKKKKPVLFSEMSDQEETDGLSFVESRESTDTDVNPEMAMDEKEVRRLVMEILNQLPEDQRMVVGMFYYEEMPVKDIAETLGVSENTVKSRLVYARKKIKEQVLELEKQGTKLYTVAPFVFFLYLLRRLESTSVGVSEIQSLQNIIESGISTASASTMPVDTEEAMTTESKKPEQPSAESATSGKTGNVKKSSKIAKTAVKENASKAITGTAAKTVARHAGIKVASLILTGAVGAGGITYGLVKHWDRLPFVADKVASTSEQNQDSNKTTEAEESTEPTPTVTMEETPSAENAENEENEEKGETTAVAEALSPTEERKIYNTFYENYVQEQNLQVISDGFATTYDLNSGYSNDVLLAACVQDFGEDGKQELLLVRTRGKEKGEHSSNYTDMEKVWYLELYGIDGTEVQARQYYEMPDSDLNSYMEGVEEQVGIRTMDGSCYIERYGMEQPGNGASLYKYTFLKITDTNLQLEDEIKYTFGATYGECTVNGTNYYTGNADSDIVNVENVLMKYDLEPWEEVGEPLITNLYRERQMDAPTYSQQDTFSVRNDFIPASDQTTQAETTDSTEETNTGLDDDTMKALKLIEGTWYTCGGTPYHYKIVFDGTDMKAYQPYSDEETYFERSVREVIPTDYGYFFQIAYDYGDYGYRWDKNDSETLALVETTDPYSMEGYSGTDSLTRNK